MTKWAFVALFVAVVGLAYAGWPAPAEAHAHRHAVSPHARDGARHSRTYASRAHLRGESAARHGHARHVAAAHAAGHHVQTGKASIYAERLRGRRMADGTRFDPASNAAASKTLPLGTTAQVTNLTNGRTALVKVRDRGPHVRGRILDVSPKSGQVLGMRREGVAPVAVAPTAGPLEHGH